MSALPFYTLAQYQVDGFQPVNVPAPVPSSLPIAPVTYNGNVEQPPSAEHGHSVNRTSGNPSPPRRRRKNSSSASPKTETEKQKTSRSKFLERNRLAASKCRQKKKDHSNQLLAIDQVLSQRNKELNQEVTELNHMRLSLKNAMFQHLDCKNPAIDAYLQQMVNGVANQQPSITESSPGTTASEYIPVSTPDTAAFGFDGPMRFSPSPAANWDELERRGSLNSINTEFTCPLMNGEPTENVEADVDFDNLLDVNKCA
ncbi:hypothetical protein P170DRAFT_368170 [Aspergillus steynii IBT 23096]|uniref:BZIP domain-containing protein n=1 Tax=Aspergillus steynii IBT 23096 TaxID=1392250 RepID=A0A2I2FUN8_9EURO|nr:uncharacterized protein P170DRAFT_368170 [Aspergillus steynii IBT 23096]PLB44342.1 hypothetical protein P170DRAFT_368170 [Aspergillus steynii IBT 23096]